MWYSIDYEKGELNTKEDDELTPKEIDQIKQTEDKIHLPEYIR